MSETRDYESLMRRALAELRELRPQVEAARLARCEPIAVVGLGCRFPGGAVDPDSFWRTLRDGVDEISEVPPDRWDMDAYYDPDPHAPGKMCTRRAGFLDDLFGFDAGFFDILPREAASMDPQHRLLLEVSHEALEHACIPVDTLYGSRTGVFVGISTFDSAIVQLGSQDASRIDAYMGTGSTLSGANGRLSYKLGLVGPSLAIDTACSSSLVAVHYACMSLRTHECDLALVGGVNALISPAPSINFSQAGMLAPDGRCKTFDARADGYVRGEGAGVLVLKRLSDARAANDRILATIRGSAVNQDGPSGGLTVPNGPSQEAVIRQALSVAGMEPADVGYVEAHGTGTPLGDPIEVGALGAALGAGRSRDDPLLVGSVKTNIGHCEAAAGVAGLIKVVLSLVHGEIPPQLHFEAPNPHIDWSRAPLEVVTRRRPWPGRRRIAGVSSFGFSGTNAHVVLEAAPATEAPATAPVEAASAPTPCLLPLSARSTPALAELAARYEAHLAMHSEQPLEAVCRSAAIGRRHLPVRIALVGTTRDAMIEQLSSFRSRAPATTPRGEGAASRGVAFLFTGQGSQYPAMGRSLYRRQPVFRAALDRCDEILGPLLGESIIGVMHDAAAARLERTELAQPALFALEYALCELWQSWGVSPSAVAGHSLGEYVAALCAGVFGLEEGLRLVAARGRLMQQSAGGKMAAVFCDEEVAAASVRPYRETVAVAAVNAPGSVVISGAVRELGVVLDDLGRRGVGHRVLDVSGAFHSPLLRNAVEAFREVAEEVDYGAPTLPLASNVTGRYLTPGETLDAEYWCRHMLAPVRFADAIGTLESDGHRVFAEIGPQPVLTGLSASSSSAPVVRVWSLARGEDDVERMLGALGELYVAGVEVDWVGVHRDAGRACVPLPTYPFQRRHYPIAAERAPAPASPPPVESRAPAPAPTSSPEPERDATVTNRPSPPAPPAPRAHRRTSLVTWLRDVTSALTGIEASEIDAEENLFAMGFDSITMMRLRQAVEKDQGVALSMSDLQRLDTLSMLAGFLDEQLPGAAGEPPAEPAGARSVPDERRSAPGVVAASAGDVPPVALASMPDPGAGAGAAGELGAIFAKQLDLMAMQIELLAAADGAPVAPATPVAGPPAMGAGTATGNSAGGADTQRASPPAATPASRRASLPYQPLRPCEARRPDDHRRQRHVESLVRRYGARTKRSKEVTQTYRPVFANIRNVAGFRPEWKELIYQIIVDRAAGSRFTDIDGREYLDITMGFGVYLFGHRPDFVEAALRESIERGVPIGPMCADAGEVARRIHELCGVERVAFFNTGSEAVMSALRLTRAVTGRPKVVMFAGSYHGHADHLLATGHAGETLPMVPGTPPAMVADTWVLPYGEEESLATIEAHGAQLAAVLVEPVQSRRPDFAPTDFLRRLREITERTGTALVFDEVILGFRVHPRGAQGWFGVQADLVTYGKAIGGGLPIGVVAGKARFLDAVDGGMWRYGDDSVPQTENTFIAGTFNHHPLAMAAARAVLEHLEREGPELQRRLNRRMDELAARLDAVFKHAGAPIRVVHFGSLFRFDLRGDWELFCYHMLEKGVYIWEGRNCFLSTAHTDEDLDFLVEAARESVTEMLAERGPAAGATGAPATGDPERLPLTAGQYRLYVQSQFDGGELGYHVPIALCVDGALDEARIRDALGRLGQRHAALRTSFEMDGEEIVSVIHPVVELELERLSIAGEDLDEVAARFIRPFDLARAPLLRVGLGEIAPGHHLLIFDAHHIVFDGISGSIFFEDFLRLYEGAHLPAPPTSYRAYVESEQAYLRSDAYAADEAYWTARLAPERERVELPTDRPRPARKSFAGLRIFRKVDGARTRALKALARREETTINTVLLAAHFLLLHRLSAAEDIVVGTAFDGRPDGDFDRVLGTFVNTIAIRGRPTPAKTLGQFLRELKQRLVEAHDHQRYPYESLVEKLGIARGTSRNALFDTLFVYEYLETSRIESGDLVFTGRDVSNRTAILDITHDVVEVDGGLNMSVEFDTDLFDRETAEDFLERYVRILDGFLADGAARAPLGRVGILGPGERARQLEHFNATARALPAATFVELFEASVARSPDAVAVIIDDVEVTYARLNERANRLSHLLIAHGVGPESRVAIALERSPELVAALLAVLKTGAAYVPIDRDAPMSRLTWILDDAAPSALVYTGDLAGRVPERRVTVALDAPATVERLATMPARDPVDADRTSPLLPAHPAYVIYTSGSTGAPKGVVVTHAGLPALAGLHIEHLRVEPASRILQFASPSFDAAVAEIVTALAAGAALVLLHEDERVGPALLDVIRRQGVTHATVPPVVLSTLPDDARLPLQCLAVAGEACRGELIERWSRDVRLFNIYGPTEATVAATLSEPLSGRDAPPIGLPLWNMRAYVLDAALEPVPAGVTGTLYLAGDGLARGYVNRPGLTAARFVPDPHSPVPGRRMYRTGDLARRRTDGSLEFLGRSDEQVKIRGYRIEPAEVEAALLAHEHVSHAAVVAREDVPGERELVAYVVPAPAATLDVAGVRRFLGERLPDYMLPAAVLVLDGLPLTANGKLDRARLPAPEHAPAAPDTVYEAPGNHAQSALVEVWAEVLGRERIGIHDSFFDLGGDSIKALQVVIRLQQRGYKLKARDLFDDADLVDLAQKLDAAAPTSAPQPATGAVRLTPVQAWFAGEALAEEHHYNQAVLLEAGSRLREDAVRAALQALQRHHDALRMSFRRHGGELHQEQRGPGLPLGFTVVDLQTPGLEAAHALEADARRVHDAMDLEQGPLMQAVLYRLADGDRLLIAIHHLVVDAVSWRILLEDLASGYEQFLAGHAIELPAKTASFQAWSEHLRELAERGAFAAERAYWEQLSAAPSPAAPADLGGAGLHGEAVRLTRNLGEETAESLAGAGRAYGTGVEALLLAALARVMRRVHGTNRTLVTLEHHGREAGDGGPDVSRTVGWFTSHYPLCLEVADRDAGPGADLERIRATLEGAPGHGLGYGVLRHLAPENPLPAGARPGVIFNYLGQFDTATAAGVFRLSHEGSGASIGPRNRRDHELEVEAVVLPQGLELAVTGSGEPRARDALEALIEALASEVRDVLAHCRARMPRGPTPCAGAGVRLDEADLAPLAAAAGVRSLDLEAVYPLSPLQLGMLFHKLLDESAGAFFNQFAFGLEGDLDVGRFHESWNRVLARHEALRARFVHRGADRPVQVVVREAKVPLHTEDLRDLAPAEQRARIEEFRQADRVAGFDLARDVLLRIAVLRTSDPRFTVVLSFHHILFDGWCMAPMFLEMVAYYRASLQDETPVLPAPVPYARYARWLENLDEEASRAFWKDELQGFGRATGLPHTDRPHEVRVRRQTLTGELPAERTGQLEAMAAQHRITLSSVLRAAWAVVLGKHNGTDDVVFGALVSGRPADVVGVDEMVGMFINTIPVRIRIAPELGFAQFTRHLQDAWLRGEPHHHLPLAEVQSVSTLGRELLDHVLVVENYPLADGLPHIQQAIGDLFTICEVDPSDEANYPLMIEAHPGPRLRLLLSFDPAVHDASVVRAASEQLLDLLGHVATSPGVAVSALCERLMTDEEKAERAAFSESLATLSEEF